MSTPNNPSSVPNHQFPFAPPQQQQQQQQQHQQQQHQQQPQYGQPGPGPNTLAQNRSSIAPHQLQLLQQVTAAARSQGMNLSPQQITLVVSMMENQGANSNPQSLMNALRSMGHGQGQGPGQMQHMGQGPAQGQGQGGGPGPGQQNQGRPGSSHGQSGQQQPQQQMQGQGPSQHTLQQQRIQQMMQQQSMQNQQAMSNQAQQYAGMQNRTGTPNSGQTDPRQSMPPPGPPMSASPRPGPMPGAMLNKSNFVPTPHQQQMMAQQQHTMMQNPNFTALPQPQQQVHLNQMQQRMIEHFMANDPRARQQSQQPPPPPQTEPSSLAQRQSTPQPGTPQTGPNGPPSGIPPHMAPPRPASAASQNQNAGSPHHSGSPMMANTPPPNNNQYQNQQPPNTHSPAPSAQSQSASVQQHSTPQPHAQSPLVHHQTGPSPRHQSATPADNNGHMSQPNAHQPPVIPPGGYTPQQQQQMAVAMNIFGQAVQAQGQTGPPGPGQPPVRPGAGPGPGQPAMNMSMGMARPPQFNPNQMPNMQGVNPAEFPFDYRIIPALRHAADPRWQSDMSQKNPGLLHAVNNAQHLISQGLVRPEVLQKMHQFYFATQSMGQVRPPPSASGPGPSAIPPQMQQQFNTGQSQGQGGPSSGHGTPSRRDSTASIVRPPPPHTIPDTPAADESRPTTSRENKVSTPTETAMPPPAWIPGQAQPTPVRPPPDARPQAGPSSAVPGPGSLPVKEWEGALRLDLPITKITTLPEESDDPTFDGKLPEMSEEEIKSVLEWMETDKAYASGMSDRKKTIQKKMVNWARNSDIDTPWWSVRKGERYMPPRARLQIMFPRDKDAQRVRRTHKGRRYTRYTPAQLKAMANIEDHVIPIRLDIEHDHFRLRDTFMWNVSDTVITPEAFAVTICDDFGVSPNIYVSKIVAIINERVAEYRDQVAPAEQPGPSLKGHIDLEDHDGKAMMDAFRRAQAEVGSDDDDESSPVSDDIRTEPGVDSDENVKVVSWEDQRSGCGSGSGTTQDDRPMTVDELDALIDTKNVQEELRLLIKVEILIGNQNLTDTFEWDINSLVTPEEFAQSYCTELGLSGEFITALAHDIHEQIITQKRCLFLTGHIVGSGLDLDDEVKTAFLPPIRNVLRTEHVAMSTYTPIFATFTDEDIQTIERERDRDSKRKKRATRARRGVILPDRDPVKTHRTLLNPIGANGVIAQAVTELAAVAPATSSRRAAAIAAQANINLLAQDLPLPQPPTPPPANHHPYKVAKTRGRGSGRGGYSRNSPASFRDEGMNGDHPAMPSSALKRAYREDTGSDINSPAPSKIARGIPNSSPTLVNESTSSRVKMEHHPSFQQGPPGTMQMPMHMQMPPSNTMGMGMGMGNGMGNGMGMNPVEIKRKPEEHIDGRDPKSARLDQMLSQGQSLGPGAFDSNPETRSNSPSTASLASFPQKETKFMPSSPSTSDSGSESSDSDYGAPKKPAQRPPVKTSKSMTPAPGRGSFGQTASPQVHSGIIPDTPAWVIRAHAALRASYPNDAFNVIPKPKPDPSAPQEWRMKCLDCPGRIYSLGPGESLSNFEVHLKNRGHRENVQNRLDKGQ